MAQHIGVQKISEDGEVLEQTDLNFAPIINHVMRLAGAPTQFPWLTTVDEYGDTVINRPQREHLVRDLEKLRPTINDPELQVTIKAVVELVNNPERQQVDK